MAVSPRDIVFVAIGFILLAILTPIGLGQVYSTITGNATAVNAAVMTNCDFQSWFMKMFQVLMPILYVIGAALYFLPKIGK